MKRVKENFKKNALSSVLLLVLILSSFTAWAGDGNATDDSSDGAKLQKSTTAPPAEEERPTANLSVSFMSHYIWRGQELSHNSMVIEPSMTIGYKGFTYNMWGNMDTNRYSGGTKNKWTETDTTISYGKQLGLFKLNGGYIYYALDSVDDSQEVFFSAGLDTLLSPTITVYREFAHYPSWYITAAISHSIPVYNEITLNLGAQASYLISEDAAAYPKVDSLCRETGVCTDKFNNFHDGLVSAALNIPVTKYITVSPNIYWAFPLSGDASNDMKWRSVTQKDDNFVYGGITASLSF
ncbi:MAG: hypothetical protein M0022_00925 [Desulfobacteraceae bacterium]|nr:hypothetical protein [Desulfobacteraceae bacterium]